MSQTIRRRRAPSTCGRPRRDAPLDAVMFVKARLEAYGCATAAADIFRCPVCDSRAPTLKVQAGRAGDEGLAVLVCAAGCAPVEILRAIGLQIMRPRDPDAPQHLFMIIPIAVA